MASNQRGGGVEDLDNAERTKGGGRVNHQHVQVVPQVEKSVEADSTAHEQRGDAEDSKDVKQGGNKKEGESGKGDADDDDEGGGGGGGGGGGIGGGVGGGGGGKGGRGGGGREGGGGGEKHNTHDQEEVEQDHVFYEESIEHQAFAEVYQPYPQAANFVYPFSFPMVPPPGSVKSVFQQQEYAFNAHPGMYPPHMSTISPVLVGSPPMWMIPQPQQWLEQIDHRGAESTGAAAAVLEGDASDLNYANPGPPIQVPKLATLNLLRTLSGESNFFSNSQLAGENHGPEGCNLFVFHIPNEITNLDLFNYFSPFGNVLSARIMVDTGTGRSRGFGFVSYDKPSSATQAIEKMNGLQLGKKRLKVQLKKDKATGPHFPPGYGPEHHGGKGKGKGRSSKGARRHQASARRALAPEEAQLEAVESEVAELSLHNQGPADF